MGRHERALQDMKLQRAIRWISDRLQEETTADREAPALVIRAWRDEFTPQHHAAVEITGLYWHFVDIIWIFLFPLLYLIERHR